MDYQVCILMAYITYKQVFFHDWCSRKTYTYLQRTYMFSLIWMSAWGLEIIVSIQPITYTVMFELRISLNTN